MISPGLSELRRLLGDLIGEHGNRPLVVFSALWPLARAMGMPGRAANEGVLSLLWEFGRSRRLFAMPAFTPGFRDAFCDLDSEPSTTGVLTDTFRRQSGVRRTVSAFFSFAVTGPQAADLVALRPAQAWGDGSVYHWFESEDVQFLMLGCHPTHCSYLHRAEQLLAERIPYRFFKQKEGRVRHERRDFDLAEDLYVRILEPEVINDLTVLRPVLEQSGMTVADFAGAPVSVMGAKAMRDATLVALSADPLMLVKNRQDFQRESEN
ncbi:aminoglycoside N3'-acetyltransferase [Bradyrhizobium sp. LB12.1]|uniref:AAC(3) family N-acetyltransferase n=1 Tax=Bradyrhizobium sp. LB12.1 TaxID=3156327 RepID=UPI003390E066